VRWACSFPGLAEPAPGRRAARTLILASRSPQRRAILEQLGVDLSVVVPDVDELEDGSPQEVAVENARRKAAAVAAEHPGAVVLGADTVVCLDGRIYGKPASRAQAAETLSALSGRRHRVIGGLCLIADGDARTTASVTDVQFRELDQRLIDWYLGTGEWRDRAGGYAIQGAGAALVTGVSGDYLNVVGLPVAALLDLAPALLG
jgi:septum formation protein